MAYGVQGFSYPVADMSSADRDWYLHRLAQQYKNEKEK